MATSSRLAVLAAPPPATGMRIRLVGLLAAGHASTLATAGHAVSTDAYVEYASLATSDLLVLATCPPEPPAWMLIRALRQRSRVPMLALVPEATAGDRCRVLDVGGDGCLDVACSEAELLTGVDLVLRDSAACHDGGRWWRAAGAGG